MNVHWSELSALPKAIWKLKPLTHSFHRIDAYSPDTDRYNTTAFYHANSTKRQNVIPTRGCHFLKEDPYLFDAAFFNITGTEAVAMDPKQRIALEIAYEAIENAGLAPKKLSGTRTACYMGSTLSDYRDSLIRDFGHHPKHYLVGMAEEMIANRISHFFDLHGPSATVATACSSSLVTIHLACQSLRTGESDVCIQSRYRKLMLLFPARILPVNVVVAGNLWYKIMNSQDSEKNRPRLLVA